MGRPGRGYTMASDPTYRIDRWADHFETSESRKRKGPLSWVGVPTKHDGTGFRRLMQRPDSMAMLGAWMLLVEVAAKCPTRGTLTDSRGRPLTAADLALRTGGDQEVLARALDVLASDDIGWICCDLPGEQQRAGTSAAVPVTSAATPAADAATAAESSQPNLEPAAVPVTSAGAPDWASHDSTVQTGPTVQTGQTDTAPAPDLPESAGTAADSSREQARLLGSAGVAADSSTGGEPLAILTEQAAAGRINGNGRAVWTQEQVDALYQLHPRREAPGRTKPAIRVALDDVAGRPEIGPDGAWAWLAERVTAYRDSPAGRAGRFVKSAWTWWTDCCYDDDPAAWELPGTDAGTTPEPGTAAAYAASLDEEPDDG